jgi:hypothetical protein
MPDGWALNCEDSIVFADPALRSDLAQRHPRVWQRIEMRRAFMNDRLGVPVDESVLPLSATPLCLPPFWLRPDRLLCRE